MLDEKGHVKLIDFGLATPFVNDEEPMSPTGSLIYMAPEMLREKTGGRYTDWWALGVLTHELLTGNSPWSSLTDKHVIKREILSNEVISTANLSTAAAFFIKSLLQHNWRARLGTNADADVRDAPFFEQIDWEATALQKGSPPIKLPLFLSEDDVSVQRSRALLDSYSKMSLHCSAPDDSWSLGLDQIKFYPKCNNLFSMKENSGLKIKSPKSRGKS